MAYEITCSELKKNTGISNCVIVPGFHKKHIFVPRGTEIDSEDLAKTLSTWTTLTQAGWASRALPLPGAVKPEFVADEPVFEDLGEGNEAYVSTNTSKDTFYINAEIVTPQYNANIQALNNGVWACYIVTSNGYIIGKSTDKVKFLPFNCSVRVLPQNKATATEAAHLGYTVRLESYEDWNLYGAAVKPTEFNPLTDITGLLDVNLELAESATALKAVIDVKTDLNADGVTSLAIGDFSFLKDSDGSAQTPESMTESATVDGRYTFVFTALVDGTVDLVAASALTESGYESTGSIEIDVP